MFWHKTYDLHLALPLPSPHGLAWHWTANNTTLFTGTYLHREPGCARRGEDRVDAAGRFSCSGHGGAVTGLVGVCGRRENGMGDVVWVLVCLYCFCGVLVVFVLFCGVVCRFLWLSFFVIVCRFYVIVCRFLFCVWLFVVFFALFLCDCELFCLSFWGWDCLSFYLLCFYLFWLFVVFMLLSFLVVYDWLFFFVLLVLVFVCRDFLKYISRRTVLFFISNCLSLYLFSFFVFVIVYRFICSIPVIRVYLSFYSLFFFVIV